MFMRHLFLSSRFFYLLGAVAFVLALGFWWAPLFGIGKVVLALVGVLSLVDVFLLFRPGWSISGKRRVPKLLSLGDENTITLELKQTSSLNLNLTIIDELPFQFQKRDFELSLTLPANGRRVSTYELRPTLRGSYQFGMLNCFAITQLGLVQRRFQLAEPTQVPVYPSVIHMREMELKAVQQLALNKGLKKIRRIGHSYEFEQIKNYTKGDDYRSINWKATSRRNELMVNQYEDERSQQVYFLLDKSRVTTMPFNGLSLMDYAINSCLALGNIILKKYDKVGLITFSDRLGTVLKAENRPQQLNLLLENLYQQEERPGEANYDLLYFASRKLITQRALLVLFTNFESREALERMLPILRRMNQFHLLVVVFFENTEITDFTEQTAQDLEGIYTQVVARRFVANKVQMQQILRQYGIQSVLTRPEELSLNTLNKYLELKAKGLI